MVVKSPTGRVNVALAGYTISVCAVFFTLRDIAAKGRATMNNAVPPMVATKQPGRTSETSASASNDLSSPAEAGVAELKRARAQSAVNSLVFMAFLIEG